jgi:ribonuclease HI
MELQALIEALKLATRPRPPVDPDRYARIVVYTDSQYVADNFGRAVYQWSRNG